MYSAVSIIVLILALLGCFTTSAYQVCRFHDHCTGAHEQCMFKYPTCGVGECQCDLGYYRNESDQCRKALQLGEPCEVSEDCAAGTGYSYCVYPENVCGCSNTETALHEHQGKLYCVHKTAGEACQHDTQCLSYRISDSHGACVDYGMGPVCGCSSSYVMRDEACGIALYGEPCIIDDETKSCEGFSTCSDGVCDCSSHSLHWSVEHRRCINNDIAKDIGPLGLCTVGGTMPTHAVCAPHLVCDICPPAAGIPNTFCQVTNILQPPLSEEN